MSILCEFRVLVKRRPIIPAKVKLQRKKEYLRMKSRKRRYNRLYVRRPIVKVRTRLRRKAKKRLGRRVRRLKVFIR